MKAIGIASRGASALPGKQPVCYDVNPSRGEVTERLKVLASKASVRETVPWVQIHPLRHFIESFPCHLIYPGNSYPFIGSSLSLFCPFTFLSCLDQRPKRYSLVCCVISWSRILTPTSPLASQMYSSSINSSGGAA